ncbi:hypothetical protein VTJ04DRAFT_9946 [Mycothermus thermophilus]|uniref:uncharacterized protein n=1 Tax=Humicola insolens TaxID=85995 RepID=UPI003743EBFA
MPPVIYLYLQLPSAPATGPAPGPAIYPAGPANHRRSARPPRRFSPLPAPRPAGLHFEGWRIPGTHLPAIASPARPNFNFGADRPASARPAPASRRALSYTRPSQFKDTD